MIPTRLTRLLCLLTALRRCAAAILRHARAMHPADVRHEHATAEFARIKADFTALRADVLLRLRRLTVA